MSRPLLPLLVVPLFALLLGACGDADGARRTTQDIARPPAANGCVVDGDGVARYRVQRGDTLSAVAQAVYGDARLWPEIARVNPDVVGDDGSVAAGAELLIPFEGR